MADDCLGSSVTAAAVEAPSSSRASLLEELLVVVVVVVVSPRRGPPEAEARTETAECNGMAKRSVDWIKKLYERQK